MNNNLYYVYVSVYIHKSTATLTYWAFPKAGDVVNNNLYYLHVSICRIYIYIHVYHSTLTYLGVSKGGEMLLTISPRPVQYAVPSLKKKLTSLRMC